MRREIGVEGVVTVTAGGEESARSNLILCDGNRISPPVGCFGSENPKCGSRDEMSLIGDMSLLKPGAVVFVIASKKPEGFREGRSFLEPREILIRGEGRSLTAQNLPAVATVYARRGED